MGCRDFFRTAPISAPQESDTRARISFAFSPPRNTSYIFLNLVNLAKLPVDTAGDAQRPAKSKTGKSTARKRTARKRESRESEARELQPGDSGIAATACGAVERAGCAGRARSGDAEFPHAHWRGRDGRDHRPRHRLQPSGA